jgi:hypothetical protein
LSPQNVTSRRAQGDIGGAEGQHFGPSMVLWNAAAARLRMIV